MEEKLPVAPFGCEWEKLQSNKKYMDGTNLEGTLPITFIVIY
jgi:hypothetical protein